MGREQERPRFAVWGARMNLRKAGGTAVCQPRFRLPRNRGVHNARPRGSLGCNVGSDEPPNHHEQSRERERNLSLPAGGGEWPGAPKRFVARWGEGGGGGGEPQEY